jgi:hypothetical protein
VPDDHKPVEKPESKYLPQTNAEGETDWATLKPTLANLLDELPKGQAYEIARAALVSDWSPAIGENELNTPLNQQAIQPASDAMPTRPETVFLDRLNRFLQLQRAVEDSSESALPILQSLNELFWNGVLRPPPLLKATPEPEANTISRWQWLHLVELWDYLAPKPSNLGTEE